MIGRTATTTISRQELNAMGKLVADVLVDPAERSVEPC
jgi:hypothetical protein